MNALRTECEMTKLKTAADVPALVKALMDASPDIGAIGDVGYCVIDLKRQEASTKIDRILDDFGPRDHLHYEIIDCFREHGRCIEIVMPIRH
jgi:hypothetical protein